MEEEGGESSEKKGNALRDQSPFSCAVDKRVKSKMAAKPKEAGDANRPNELNSPELAKYLELYMFPLAPLWSGMMLGKC